MWGSNFFDGVFILIFFPFTQFMWITDEKHLSQHPIKSYPGWQE